MSAVIESLFPSLAKKPAPAKPQQTRLGRRRLLDLNTMAPGFIPGPYLKRPGDRCLYAEVGGDEGDVPLGLVFQGLSPAISPAMSEATAQLLKASPDMFAVLLELARLSDQAYELGEDELRRRLAALFNPAEWALARATGLLG